LLEPILEPTFSEHSYGFRPNRNQEQAVQAALEMVKEGKEFVADIDISKFFDSVGHDRLISRLSSMISDKRILRIIGLILRSGVMKEGVVTVSNEGTVQGSPLSPLLSNFVLDELDKELEKRGHSYVRFADDCNIFVKTRKAAERVLASISRFLETKLKLRVNREKSKAARSDKVRFLGMTIVNKTLAISKKSIDRAMEKVKQLTFRKTHLPIEKAMEKINLWFVGWSNYYKMTQYPSQILKIEAHVRRRLRSRFVSQSKRKRYLVKKLRALGVKQKLANQTVYSNKRTWGLSHTRALEQAFSNSWFEKIGLKVMSHRQLEHWFGIRQWIKVP
jgi:group II intron reverse transcriptase/maturase